MCSGTSYPVGQHIATVVLLVTFFCPTVLYMYLHMVHGQKENKEGYTKLVLPLDIIRTKLSKEGLEMLEYISRNAILYYYLYSTNPSMVKSKSFFSIFLLQYNFQTEKISKSQKSEKISPEVSLSLKTELSIPKIEIEETSSPTKDKIPPSIEKDNSTTYVSLSEVDHSKISPQAVTPACTPNTEYPNPMDQGSPFRAKNLANGCQQLSDCEPFMSLTSFDARTKPGTTFGLKFDSAFFLGAISLYHMVQGVAMGQNVQVCESENKHQITELLLL